MFWDARKGIFTSCENSSQNLGCSKTSSTKDTHNDGKVHKPKSIYHQDVPVQENNPSIQNIYFMDVRLQWKIWEGKKNIFTTRENSSQNLGCSKTSTTKDTHNDGKVHKPKSIYHQDVPVQENNPSIQNIYFMDVRLQWKFWKARKCIFTRCENSSQNLGCSRTSSTSDTYNDGKVHKPKSIYHQDVSAQENNPSIQNIYFMDVRLQWKFWKARKCILTRCENSSQNLGCSMISSTTDSYVDGKIHKQKSIYHQDVSVQENNPSIQNIYFMDVRLQWKFWEARK